MKRIRMIAVSVFVMFALGLLSLSGCAGPEAGWSIVGTWMNSDYDGDAMKPAKIVVSENSVELFNTSTDSSPSETGSFEVTDDWTEENYHYYECRYVVDGSDETWYNLSRLSNEGNTYESIADETGYPATIDTGNVTYGIYTRQ